MVYWYGLGWSWKKKQNKSRPDKLFHGQRKLETANDLCLYAKNKNNWITSTQVDNNNQLENSDEQILFPQEAFLKYRPLWNPSLPVYHIHERIYGNIHIHPPLPVYHIHIRIWKYPYPSTHIQWITHVSSHPIIALISQSLWIYTLLINNCSGCHNPVNEHIHNRFPAQTRDH